jgi:orotate phosphoribosyltransferase
MKQIRSINEAQEITNLLLKVKAVSINTEKQFKFVSGMLSPVYVDNRKLISYPEIRKRIVELFVNALREDLNQNKFGVVAGVATGGIPWAAWVAHELDVPMIYIRSVPKERGMQRQIEGDLKADQSVIIIEDLITTGLSSTNAVDAVRISGGLVDYCLSVFSFDAPSAIDKFKKNNAECYSLTSLSVLMDVAYSNNYINNEQLKVLDKWSKTTLASYKW